MTSARFSSLALESIIIQREARQRRELPDLPSLAESIRSVGLINPIVVTSDGVLVAGERRLEACRMLGWTSIPVQFAEDLDPIILHLIELEENVKRVDLTWQEHNDAIATYHKLRSKEAGWNQVKTAEALGISESTVAKHVLVAQVRKESPEVQGAEKFSTALNQAQRIVERKRDSAMKKLAAPTAPATAAAVPELEPEPVSTAFDIQHGNFLTWCRAQQPVLFNLIHCDFPYGVNVGDKQGLGNAQSHGHYEDTPDVYFELLSAFIETQDNFCSSSAHMIFWFSMKYYEETVRLLTAGGWRVDAFPLIWHKSDNAGIIPDANRGPRRTYETALFATRGDRKIVKPVANSFSAPTTKEFHTSEKPDAVLRHFFRMVCDEYSRLLDPTCGSGMAVKIAQALGAEFALGIERDEEFVKRARKNCGLDMAD